MKSFLLMILPAVLAACSSTITMYPSGDVTDFDDLLAWDLVVRTPTTRHRIAGGTAVIGEYQGRRFLRGNLDDNGDRLLPLDSIAAVWPQVRSIVSFAHGRDLKCNTGEAGFSVRNGHLAGILLPGHADQAVADATAVTLIDPEEGEKDRLRTIVTYGLVSAATVGLVVAFVTLCEGFSVRG